MNTIDYENISLAKRLIKSSDNKKKNEGINLLLHMSKKQNRYALYELGILYKEGVFVEKNIQKASNLLLFSGDLGYEKAFYELGMLYLNNKNYDAARKSFLKCKHHSKAFYELGRLSSLGLGCSLSKHKAFNYYYSSSLLGCPEADYMLANAFIYGDGIKINRSKGIHHLKRAKRKNVKDVYHLYGILDNNQKMLITK